MTEIATVGKWLLVSDLDGTLLGHRDALIRFESWLETRRRQMHLTYATGRTFEEVQTLIDRGTLPRPDHVIGSVGAELIDYRERRRDREWEAPERFPQWNHDRIRAWGEADPDLELQPEACQSARKVCFLLPTATRKQLERLNGSLERTGIPAYGVYSGSMYFDVLPIGVSKGLATRFLAKKIGVASHQVICCGDSANDISLFQEGFKGVIVRNAEEDLLVHARGLTHRSKKAFADGVIDGVEHWVGRSSE